MLTLTVTQTRDYFVHVSVKEGVHSIRQFDIWRIEIRRFLICQINIGNVIVSVRGKTSSEDLNKCPINSQVMVQCFPEI